MTVIATGFGEPVEEEVTEAAPHAEPIVIGSRYGGPRLVGTAGDGAPAAAANRVPWDNPGEELEDLEIPTFIRRQMD